MIRIKDGPNIYKRLVQQEVSIPGISPELCKFLSTCKKEQEEEEKLKKKKEEREKEKIEYQRSFRMQGMYGRYGGDRFFPYNRFSPGTSR